MLRQAKSNLTVHIRLTKQCNADCSYCSSVERNGLDARAMSSEQFSQAVSNLATLIKSNYPYGDEATLTVQYVGGEVLFLPYDYIHSCVETTRKTLSPLFSSMIDGVQEMMGHRVKAIHRDCLTCPFYQSCQGGCMAEAMGEGGSAFDKPSSCSSWKAIFNRIDSVIDQHGHSAVSGWLSSLTTAEGAKS